MGQSVLSRLSQDLDARLALYDEAVEVSKKLISVIDDVIQKLQRMKSEGREIFS